ncbi:SCO2322 family protein [Streptomyces boninensis]|uniref:SCO2322 family protein n=1 Tax=Streptomyces boninensis TaxID=2039455 RepID=UPI003B20C36B
MRRALPLLLAVLAAALLATPAGAASAYRYWSFWETEKDTWSYATKGPAIARPADGDVIGFRYAVSEDSGSAAKPRTKPSFETACADTPAADGKKRVAVVIDFGTPKDAATKTTPPKPRTECATLPEDGTAADAIATTAKPLRTGSDGLICAIAGYPKSGCAETVDTGAGKKKPAAQDEQDDSGPSVGLFAGAAAVVALAAATVWQLRRRRA